MWRPRQKLHSKPQSRYARNWKKTCAYDGQWDTQVQPRRKGVGGRGVSLFKYGIMKYKARSMGELQCRAGTWNTWDFQLHDRTPLRIKPMCMVQCSLQHMGS